jgi:SAM-dependent methyltransferase
MDFSTDAASFYTDGAYEANNPTWHVEHSPWKSDKIAGILKKNGLNFNSACEVGCGAGHVLSELSKRYPGEDKRFSGFDISPQAIAKAKKLENDQVSFHVGSPFGGKTTYDLVLAIDVIEHVENCMDFVRNVRDCGKIKVFHIPLDLSAQIILRSKPLLRTRAEVGHIHYFTKDIALKLLEETGNEVIDWCYTDASLSFPSGWKGKLMNIFRGAAFRLMPDLAVRALGGWSLMVVTR